MNKIICIPLLSILFFSCTEKFDLKKQEKLADLSERLFSQKKINFEEVLNLIKKNTTTKFIDTSSNKKLRTPMIYADNAAKTYFTVYEKPKGIIQFMTYHKNGKEIYVVEYYNNGIAMCLFNTTREGVRNGLYECYHKNGRIRTKGTYMNGKISGKEIQYDTIGNITSEFDYDKK